MPASRPPCSVAERETAATVGRHLRSRGLDARVQTFRAPTSPTWSHLLRALLRVWGAAFLAAGWPRPAAGLAAASIAFGLPALGGLIRFVPLVGATSRNVVAVVGGTDEAARPLVVVAHLDTHSTAGSPMHRLHAFMAGLSAVAIGLVALTGQHGAAAVAAIVALECVLTLGWLSWRELETPKRPPDDNTSGLLSLLRTSDLATDTPPRSDLWIVATGAGTSGGYGMSAFLRATRTELREAWIVEIDALGTGEVVASPISAHLLTPGTPAPLVRAITAAAREGADPLTARRVYRPHSEARMALRRRFGAIVLTGGIRPPAPPRHEPDPANAERVARVLHRLTQRPSV